MLLKFNTFKNNFILYTIILSTHNFLLMNVLHHCSLEYCKKQQLPYARIFGNEPPAYPPQCPVFH